MNVHLSTCTRLSLECDRSLVHKLYSIEIRNTKLLCNRYMKTFIMMSSIYLIRLSSFMWLDDAVSKRVITQYNKKAFQQDAYRPSKQLQLPGEGVGLDTLPVRYTAPTGYPTPLPPAGAWDQRYPVPWKGPGIRDTLHPLPRGQTNTCQNITFPKLRRPSKMK